MKGKKNGTSKGKWSCGLQTIGKNQLDNNWVGQTKDCVRRLLLQEMSACVWSKSQLDLRVLDGNGQMNVFTRVRVHEGLQEKVY